MEGAMAVSLEFYFVVKLLPGLGRELSISV
jgi:hypothetical protein